MIFEEFEGFKRIKNTRNLNIEELYNILEKFQTEMGEIDYRINEEEKMIHIDLRGKYDATVRILNNEILIERILEEGKVADQIPTEERGKKIPLAKADRMIDQIYDLIKDYMEDEKIDEPITSSKMTLRMQQKDKISIAGVKIVNFSDDFEIRDMNNKLIFESIEKKFNNTYLLKNEKNYLEVGSVNFAEFKTEGTITIIERPFQVTVLKKDNSTEKVRFIQDGTGQKIKITGDYTDNHYVIELNEIVIGAVDCLEPRLKNDYRIEVNDIKKMNLVVVTAIMINAFLKRK